MRQNTSWETLVRRWKKSGVKIVYLAAWHFWPRYQFPYDYFIALCHDSGIAVYAWFELPQVTPLFWEQHPDWREKTDSGRDGKVNWRLQINLNNPQAREAVKEFFWRMLMSHDWDGVNLAELNYDTANGLKTPGGFTPMNRRYPPRF